jgi:hypothetical protein
LRRVVRVWVGAIPLLIACAALGGQEGTPADPALVPGTPLPVLQTTSLAGESVALPADAVERPVILVFSFSKEAAEITSEWVDACVAASKQPGGETLACYDVRMLEEVPEFLRSMMERSMKKQLGVDRQRRTLLAYARNDAWRSRLGARDSASASVVACDATGAVRLTATGPFIAAEMRALLDAIRVPAAPR